MSTSQVSPLAYVGPGVELGSNVAIGPGAVVLGPAVVEDGAWIGPGAQIGAPPEMSDKRQNTAWTGDLEHAGVRVGRNAVIRENAVIHQGSYRETTIGAESWILAGAYIAHDVLVGENTTVSAGVSIGGHCLIGPRVNIGMNASIHQRRVIGAGSMIGMGTPVTRDVPPYAKVFGSPVRLHGLNLIALKRRGITDLDINFLAGCYSAGESLLARLEEVSEESLLFADTNWWSEHAVSDAPHTSTARSAT